MLNEPHKRHIYQRKDGRFEAQYISGVTADGKARYIYVYGKTYADVEAQLESADRLYKFSKRETVQNVFFAGPPASTLEEALTMLKTEFDLRGISKGTTGKYYSDIRKFVTTLRKEDDLASITVQDVKNYIHNQRYACGMAASTCNGYIDGIRNLFLLALKRPFDNRLFPHFRDKKVLPEVLTPNEISLLFAAINSPVYLMIAKLMYSAGLRISEAVSLRISDIRRDKMLIFISQGKGSKDRYAVLSKRCLADLEDYWRKFRPKDYFFPSVQAGKKHVTTRSVQDAISAAAKAAGISKRVTPHTLRHCFATQLIEADTGLFQTKEAMGHVSLRSTQRYVHLAGLPGVVSPYDAL